MILSGRGGEKARRAKEKKCMRGEGVNKKVKKRTKKKSR
jgi:hypothetical protein